MFNGMLRQVERAGAEIVRRPSHIVGVVVHARGALVRREVELGELPSGQCAVVVEGLPRMASPGSVRAMLRAEGREILSVRSVMRSPEVGARGTVDEQEVRRIERALRRERAKLATLDGARARLRGARLDPREAEDEERRGAAQRVRDTFVFAEMLDGLLERHDAERREVSGRVDALAEELAAARTSGMEASTAAGDDVPSWAAIVHMSEGAGEVERLVVSYVVPAARWWPTYTLRLDAEGESAEWSIEAMVAQVTGEDWSMVPMSLSTADLNMDATLPSLPALKLSKKQPEPPRSGFREPPEGLERLFDAYDESVGGKPEAKPLPRPRPKPVVPVPPQAFDHPVGAVEVQGPPMGGMVSDYSSVEDLDDDECFEDDGMYERSYIQEGSAPMPSAAPMVPMAPMAAMAPEARSRGLFGAFSSGGAPRSAAQPMKMKREVSRTETITVTEEIETGEGWLDFDALVVRGPGHQDRGKLGRVGGVSGGGSWSLEKALVRAGKLGVSDPLDTRGHYDHRYDTVGRVEVPSDGALHRLRVDSQTGWAERWWRTVPREEEAVFRMVKVINPHEAPLLAGPVDVFVGGSFVLSTSIDNTSRGGSITLGMGVDERVRVARNARVEEEQVGLISSKTVVEHHVRTELRSGLGFTISVEVLDRVPIARDEGEVAVELEASRPPAGDYDQEEEGRLVEGGLRWLVELGPGEEREVTFSYKMVFSAREEIVGGNRREQ